MRLRDLHKKRAVKHNAQNHLIKYKELRNKVNSQFINNLLGKNTKSNNICYLKIDDVTITSDDKLLVETFNEFFCYIILEQIWPLKLKTSL